MLLKLKDGTMRQITTSSRVKELLSQYKSKRRDGSHARMVRAERVRKAQYKGKSNVGDPKAWKKGKKG